MSESHTSSIVIGSNGCCSIFVEWYWLLQSTVNSSRLLSVVTD